jgi:hypothetical protein
LDGILARVGQDGFDVAASVSAVMKRVAMVEYGRTSVAYLTGNAWLDFLAHAGSGHDTSTIRTLLATSRDGGTQPDTDRLQHLVAQAKRWVRHHRTAAAPGA